MTKKVWETDLERCTLHLRLQPHVGPGRKSDEAIVEIRRGDEVLGFIYGSREGVHISSPLTPANGSFLCEGLGPSPMLIVPLLRPEDVCPWCQNSGVAEVRGAGRVDCPVCARRREAV